MPPMDNEDRYFLEKEAKAREQLRAELEAQAQAAAKRQALASQVGGNEPLAQRLHTVILAQLPVVLALPRAGVPVAAEVACAVHAPLDPLPGTCRA